ncbi:MAG: RND transporter, partial [Planctomycetaceae bacterium]
PVTQFGYAAALGAVVAMASGLLITPAILTILPAGTAEDQAEEGLLFARLARWLLPRHRMVTAAFAGIAAVTLLGLWRVQTKIDPLDFLPARSRVVADVLRIQNELTTLDSIEAIVEFPDPELAFVERLARVEQIERRLASHPAVRHTLSAAMFFPSPLPDNPVRLLPLLQRAQSQQGGSEFVADGQGLCRVCVW